jgi:hypothetical protein
LPLGLALGSPLGLTLHIACIKINDEKGQDFFPYFFPLENL